MERKEQKPKILVLEDYDILLDVICEYLAEFTNCHVVSAVSESEALVMLREDPEIGVVVANLGENRDARFIFLGVLKTNYPAVKRVLFTGFSQEEMLGDLRTPVCDAVVYKPRIEDLLPVVDLSVPRSR